MEQRIINLKNKYLKEFGDNPKDVFISPGRIELLGNHTDHNHGLVLVSSVNLNITAVVSKTNTNTINIFSEGFDSISVNLNDLNINENEYGTSKSIVKGTLNKFKELGYNIGSFNAFMDSTIPSGSGVSSSAAFELLIGVILNDYFNNGKISKLELAKIGQYAENVYFNKPCGLLDQCGISFGGINYIDFNNINNPQVKNIKIEFDDYQFILIKTGGTHEKLTKYYSSIKDDMHSVASFFNKEFLRDASYEEFNINKDAIISSLGIRAYERALHFYTENIRVSKAFNALLENNKVVFLENLRDSGLSSYKYLKNCYCESEEEALPKALIFIRSIDKDCYSRVHGGGFAGTALMIVKKVNLEEDLIKLEQYFGKENIILVKPTLEGTRKIGG